MQGNKTHQQQRNIIEGRENTTNGDPGFNIRADLNRSEAARDAYRRGETLDMRAVEVSFQDDPAIIRGVNQASEHRKGSGS